jgi:hypothetical protein
MEDGSLKDGVENIYNIHLHTTSSKWTFKIVQTP